MAPNEKLVDPQRHPRVQYHDAKVGREERAACGPDATLKVLIKR